MTCHQFRTLASKWLAVILSIYTILAVWSMYFQPLVQLCIFMALAYTLIFIARPIAGRKSDSLVFLALDIIFSLMILAVAGYIWQQFMELIYRAGAPNFLDILVSIIAVLFTLEAARRTVGWVMIYIAVAFLLYAFFGQYLFPPLSHGGYDTTRILTTLFLSENGVVGVPMSVMFNFIYLFIVFGALFTIAGGTEFFITLARILFGGMVGGPAKVAVVTSGLMGTISGSAVANTVTTGNLTIPLMKRIGFESQVAAAVEASASTGGQLMPPIMGAAAFVMADYLSIPYAAIIKAALLPAILFYLALFAMVHFYIKKIGTPVESGMDLPKFRRAIKDLWIFFPPLLLLIILLAIGRSPSQVVLLALFSVFVMSMFNRKARIGPRKAFDALEKGGMDSLNIISACATAGIVVGVVLLTGLGVKIGNAVIAYTYGHLFLALPFVMIASIILGMGLPTVVCYILLAVTVAPPLIKLGAEPALAAHLFIFYFGMMSMVTPPVGFAAYAGAAIAGTSPMKTAFTAWKFSLAGFLLPYMFVYNPSLLLMGAPLKVLLTAITSLIGMVCLSAGVVGFVRRPMLWIERIFSFIAAILLIKTGVYTDSFGLALALIIMILQFRPVGPVRRPSIPQGETAEE